MLDIINDGNCLAAMILGEDRMFILKIQHLPLSWGVNVADLADVLQGRSLEAKESVRQFAFAKKNTDVFPVKNVEKRW